MIETFHREAAYLWYYFDLQLRQIFLYFILGIVLGSMISVFAKDRIHGLFQKLGILGVIPASILGIASPLCMYATYVMELVEEAKKTCKDPVVLIEQRLDFSRFVEEGFGTGDCVVIVDGTLYVIDYKHGKGVEVSAVENPQMMLYALGALELFDDIYDIDTVRMSIYQPRRENVSVCVMAKDDLLQWA